MQHSAQLVESAYDQIAGGYDQRWSVHLRAPQQRLTQALALTPGLCCADLGCGTGVDTLDMAALIAPNKVVAVDCSSKMLDEARARAAREGYELDTVCMDAESFIQDADSASFDVVSLRFCLAYLAWRNIPKRLARVLRSGGRIGILTNLGTSTPQALATYRSMVRDLGLPDIALPVPLTIDELTSELARAGLSATEQWTHRFHLWFDSGAQVSAWLAESGFVTHPALSAAPAYVRRALWDTFAARIEAHYREKRGIRLDFELAGVVATHR